MKGEAEDKRGDKSSACYSQLMSSVILCPDVLSKLRDAGRKTQECQQDHEQSRTVQNSWTSDERSSERVSDVTCFSQTGFKDASVAQWCAYMHPDISNGSSYSLYLLKSNLHLQVKITSDVFRIAVHQTVVEVSRPGDYYLVASEVAQQYLLFAMIS